MSIVDFDSVGAGILDGVPQIIGLYVTIVVNNLDVANKSLPSCHW